MRKPAKPRVTAPKRCDRMIPGQLDHGEDAFAIALDGRSGMMHIHIGTSCFRMAPEDALIMAGLIGAAAEKALEMLNANAATPAPAADAPKREAVQEALFQCRN